jgi:hypothetical protein
MPCQGGSLVVLVYFGQAVVFAWADYWHHTFNKRASVTIDDDGIEDHSGIYAVGKIAWQNIRGFEIRKKLGMETHYTSPVATTFGFPGHYFAATPRLSRS